MTVKEFYNNINEDYGYIESLFKTDERIIKFLKIFSNDTNYNDLLNNLKSGNIQDAFRNAHTLKGMSANLGMNNLCKAASDLTEVLRPLPSNPNCEKIIK